MEEIIKDIQIINEGNEEQFLEKIKEMSSQGYKIVSTQYFQDQEYKFIESYIATMAKYESVIVAVVPKSMKTVNR